ncbi:uncharacterized protein LOC134795199 [Cydia splendana]|uniref:uncharacterized protein LOC134795199 n=1 Tax=Cydia splendana TaxID=1100963 RepID=UPI00300D2FF4
MSDNETTEKFEPAVSSPLLELSGIATNIRIPPIWRDQIRLWFVQFESIVAPLKKGDQAMYELAIAKLERQDLDEVSDILLKPPETKKYETLKTRLTTVYEESKERSLQRLLSEMELGDLKPSQLLRRMKTLAGSNISETALRILWSNHLPLSVRAVVVSSDTIMKDINLNDIALMADKILEQTRKEISAISAQPSTSTTSSEALSPQKTLEDKLDYLVREVAEIKIQQKQYRRNTYSAPQFNASRFNRPYSRTRSNFQNLQPSSSDICFYHRRFGDSAYKCTIPCNFKKSNNKEN